MACKPELGMKKIAAKAGYFIEGASPKDAGRTLASQMGGDVYKWEMEVKKAIKDKVLVSERSTKTDRQGEGKLGYRVHAPSQQPSSSVTSPAPANDSRLVMA
jgi:hypothetical protein